MQIRKVIIVFKTHFDIGFTQLSRDILDYYAGDMLDRVAETCNATKDMGDLRYVWTMPSWPLKEMRARCDGRRAALVDDLIARRQLTWHALPFTSHYDFCGVEDAVHGLRYARELSEQYREPLRRAAKMTDVPGYGRFLPELLAGAGIRFLHLGCNEFAMPADVPSVFWWEAPSGKRVLTMYNSGYGTAVCPPEDWPFSAWPAIMNTQDNSGPQTAGLVSAIVDKIREKHPDAEVICGTLEDVWEALSAENLDSLPVVRADLADTWIHGVASYPKESAAVRRLRGRIARVKRAMTRPGAADVSEDTALALDRMALFAEHTWGLDVKTWLGPIPDYEDFDSCRTSDACRKMEESWQEQRDRVAEAEAACARAEAALGLESPAQPAFAPKAALRGEQSLTRGRYRLDFSADTGVIHGLYDLRRDCWLLRERDGAGVFSYRYDRYGADDMTEYLRAYAHRFSDWGLADNGRIQYPECDHVTRTPDFVSCEQDGGAIRFRYAAAPGERFGDADEVILTVTLPGGDDPVRVRAELKGKRATPYVESGALCFPLAADHPRYLINKTGSVLDPSCDIARNANHAFYALEHFAAAEDGRALVGVVSHDAPLVSLGENGVHVFRSDYVPHAPELRFCLFNNMWGTNFPQWIEGDFAFEFDVLPEAPGNLGALYARASALAENPDGLAPVEIPFALSDGLRLTGVDRDGDGWILRVQSCEAAPVRGSIRRDGCRFEAVDLLGRPLGEVWDNAAEAAFGPYELRAFRASAR